MTEHFEQCKKAYEDETRYYPKYKSGLSAEQVETRQAEDLINYQEKSLTPTVSAIIRRNTLTLFNLINVFLAVLIILVGHIENTLFMGVVLCNALMGIWQELRSKRTLDKLSVLTQARARVVRDGKLQEIAQQEIVLDDIMLLKAGDQVCADALVLRSRGLEADESLLTGETDRIEKKPGSGILSGSYITGGQAHVQVMAVGKNNYAASLAKAAKKSKGSKSKLLQLLNRIIQGVTILIVPIGLLLFFTSYYGGSTLESAVLGTSAAVIGMIPNGLILLTSITLTVGAMNLARREALVQSLPSIETLARADVLCLDKTGTITDGALKFERLECASEVSEAEVQEAVSQLMGTLKDSNVTALALEEVFGSKSSWKSEERVVFSSDRKWSGASFGEKGTYILGAPNIVLGGAAEELLQQLNSYAEKGFRVLCLAFSKKQLAGKELPDDLKYQAAILFTDRLRDNAENTFGYFEKEGVTIKVISGDNPRTVRAVALQAGIAGAENCIDMRQVEDQDDYLTLVEENTVFGHVRPDQKQKLIKALQENGHTTCMTGDGVNDILAMREADCSVAMANGSEAARSACDFVLMSSNFGTMVNVLKEGRRVINNIERVASLYIVNTVYSALLSLIYTFLPYAYPFAPLQMTPVNGLTVGIPSFFLALEKNYKRPASRFVTNIFEYAVPAALTIVFNTLYLQLACTLFGIPQEESSTMIVMLIGTVGFFMLYKIMRPFTKRNRGIFCGLAAAFVCLFVFLGETFMYQGLFSGNVFFYLPLAYISYHFHDFLSRWNHRLIVRFTESQ